jgi:hypothetical protein
MTLSANFGGTRWIAGAVESRDACRGSHGHREKAAAIRSESNQAAAHRDAGHLSRPDGRLFRMVRDFISTRGCLRSSD